MSSVRGSVLNAHARLLNLRVGVLTGSLLLASVGCAVKPGSDAAGANPILGGGITDELDALAIVDPEVHAKVGDCVDSAKFKVYSGDPAWQQTWTDVGESDAGLRDFCESMAARDPATFDKIHTDWVAWEAFVAAESALPAPPPVVDDSSGCHPSYTPCVPISTDVDCSDGGGDGPEYVTGPIQVIGDDEYGIDDGDGIACEPV